MKKKKIIKELKRAVKEVHGRFKMVNDSGREKDYQMKSQQYMTAIIHLTFTIGKIIEAHGTRVDGLTVRDGDDERHAP